MAKAGLSFGSPILGAMDLEPLGNPYDPAPDIGVGNLIGAKEALGTQIDAAYSEGMSQFSMPEVKRPAPTGPNVLFDPQQNKMFVNGSLFDLDDADAAVKSRSFLDGPRQAAPAGSWQQVTPAEYGKYIKSITDPTLSRRFSENFDTGMAQLRSLFGAGAVLVGADEYGLGVMERAEEDIRKNAPFSGEFTDIGMGDEDLGPVEWFVGVLGAQGPMLLETIAAAGIGFIAGSAAAGPGLGSAAGTVGGLFGKTAFKKAVKEAAEEYATIKARDGKAAAKAFLKTDKGKVLKRASGAAGAVGLSYANNFGIAASDTYSELLESGVDVDDFNAKMSALTAAVPYALLDTIPEFVVGAKIFGGLRAGSKGSRLRRGATGVGVGGALEGATEAGQEAIIMGTTSAYTGREYESDEVLNRLINSFAAGAAIGGTIGGVANLKGSKEADLLQGSPAEQEPEIAGLLEAPKLQIEGPKEQEQETLALPAPEGPLLIEDSGTIFVPPEQTAIPMPPPAPPTPPQPVENVVESIQQTAETQPQAEPNLLQQRMQEAAQRKLEADAEAQRQAEIQAENDRLQAEQTRIENERIERNNRELLNSLQQQRAEAEIAAFEAEQAGLTAPDLSPVAAPVQDLPTVPLQPAPPRQMDLFRGQVKVPRPTKAEQKAINKENRLRRKQEREFQKAQEEAARPMTPAEARAAGQGILFTQRGEPSVAALKAAGTVAPTTTPELVQATPAEEAAVAQQQVQQQEINVLKQQVQALQEERQAQVQAIAEAREVPQPTPQQLTEEQLRMRDMIQERMQDVPQQSTAEVDGGQQARPSEGVPSSNAQERAAAAANRSEERLREAQDSKAASRTAQEQEAVRGSGAEQGVQEDSVQRSDNLDPDSDVAIVEDLKLNFDLTDSSREAELQAIALMDYAYWSAAPSGTNAEARDYRAARNAAKAYVDQAFTDPDYFTDGQIKILDKVFTKFAATAEERSSTQAWYEYATKRGLAEALDKKLTITGKPHKDIMGDKKITTANVSEAQNEDSTTMDEAIKAADSRPENGNNFLIDSDKPITKPLDKIRVQAIAFRAVRKLKTKPTVSVYRDQAELQRENPELFNRANESRPDGSFSIAPAAGFSVGDQIILFSDRIQSEQQAKFIVAHEAMGHFGMKAFLPTAQLNKVLNEAYLADPSLRAMVNRRVEMGMERTEAIEETLADMAADLDASLIKRVWYAIKDALEAIGMNFDDSIARYLLRQSRRNLLQGGSGLVSMQELGNNLKSLQSDNTLGRYSLQEDTANAASQAIASHAYTKRAGDTGGMQGVINTFKKIRDIENIRDVGVWFGELAENLQSLDNLATRSLGLQKVFNIFQARANRARRFLSNYESMTTYSHQAIGGPSTTELERAGQHLANVALFKSQNTTEAEIRGLHVERDGDKLTDLIIVNENGIVGVNSELYDLASQAGSITREEIDAGIRLTFGDTETDVNASETYIPRDADGNVVRVTDNEWRIFNEQRAAVNQAALDVVRSTVEGALAQKDATLTNMKKRYGLSDADSLVVRQIMDRYVALYQEGAQQEGGRYAYKQESVKQARDFLREINRALFKKEKAQDFKAGKDGEKASQFQGPEYQGIIDGLDSLSALNLTQKQANQITSAVGNLYLLDIQIANAQYNAKRTIMTSYVPFTRRGDHQIRLVAMDSNGDAVQLGEVWKSVLPYYQAQGRADAREIMNNLQAEFDGREFTLEDANGNERTITFRAVAEKSRQGSVLGQQMNLTDFTNTLARLDVNINPQELERIVEALTAQTQRARRSLERAGVKGWDRDVIRSTSEYLEMQGHIAGQAFYRHRLNEIMLDDSNWRGDAKKLKRLYDEATNTEGKSPEQIRKAQTEYDKYAYMYQYMAADGMPQAVNRITGKSMKNLGRGEDYRGTALGLQQWFADAANINNSTEDLLSGETGSQLKMWTVIAQLGGSIATAGINLVSMMTHSVPFLGTYNEARGFGGGFGMDKAAIEMQLAARNMINGKLADAAYTVNLPSMTDQELRSKHGINRAEAIFLADATSEGVLQAAQANALVGTARGGVHSNKLQGAIKAWMGMFSYTEQLNRRATALAAFRLHKQRAIAGTPEYTALEQKGNKRTVEEQERFEQLDNQFNSEATEFARTAVNTSQGEYGMFNRPEMARGNVGQYLFIYKQFSIITIQMMKGMSPSGRIYFLSMLFLMSGLKGMPFADDLADLIDTLMQMFGIKQASIEEATIKLIDEMAPGLAPVVMRGFLDQIAAGTFSTRLGFGDMIPMTGALRAGADTGRELENFFGPVYSGLSGAFTTAGNFAKYGAGVVGLKDQTMTFTEAFRESPVAAMRGVVDAYTYYDTGVVTNSQGKVIDPSADWAQIAFRAMGFYPAVATRENDIVRLGKYSAEYVKSLRAQYTGAYVKAYIEKDLGRMLEVEAMVRDWNMIHRGTKFEFKDFRDRAKRSAKSAAMPTGQRYLKTAPTNIRSDLQVLMDIYDLNDEKL